VVDTSIALTDPTGTVRSATSIDGTSFLYFSTSQQVRYVPTPGPAATSTVIDARNSRQVNLSGNVLFASNGSTAITAKLQSYGTLPTGTTTASTIVTLASGDSVNGFALFDLSPTVAGDDTIYLISQIENLVRKYTFDGSNWNDSGSIGASGTANLAGEVIAGNVNLYLTSPTGLFAFSDTSGYNGPLSGTLGSSIATADPNTAFRGIGLFPIPEPNAVFLSSVGLVLVLGTHRRNATPSPKSP
jgi:hypothetical protein